MGHEQGGVHNALTDHQGSVLGHVSETGAATPLTHYDPYGAPRAGASPSEGIGYAGEWADATGLLNLRARAYDPTLGRFISRDTFGGVASAPLTGNRYLYGLGNPGRYTDPSGHFVAQALGWGRAGILDSLISAATAGSADAYGLMVSLLDRDPTTGGSDGTLDAELLQRLGDYVLSVPFVGWGDVATHAYLGQAKRASSVGSLWPPAVGTRSACQLVSRAPLESTCQRLAASPATPSRAHSRAACSPDSVAVSPSLAGCCPSQTIWLKDTRFQLPRRGRVWRSAAGCWGEG
ncbi:MAG: RHS repeat-associated core domain-containing protein [Chloroflexi bacterium]|nr:RHS repeat-associated core domain-containing protein [Chloroflexota bacterium]